MKASPPFEAQIPLFRSWDVADFVGKASSALLLFLVVQNLYLGRYFIALAEVVIMTMLLINVWSYGRGKASPVPMSVLLYSLLALICGAVFLYETDNALWSFPLVLGAFITVPLSRALFFAYVTLACVGVTLEVSGEYFLGVWFALSFGFCVLLMRISVEQAVTLQQELLESSFRDSMTGCHNRRLLENMRAMPEMEDTSYGLILIDVDDFKAINDGFGHAIGDLVLVQIAHKIRAEVPEEALVLRTGGDEFLILLREVDRSVLRAVAEALLERIPATVRCGGRAVTISIGLSENRPLSELDEALVSADRYLLDAKRTGRNRIGETLISLGNPA